MGDESPTVDARTTPARPSGRRRWFSSQVKAAIATVAGVGILLIAALPWYLSDPDVMASVLARVLPDLQAEVAFDRVRLGWVGPIRFEGIRLVPRDGGRPPLAIGSVEIGNGFAGVLLTGGDLGRVRIEGLAADVVFDENRRSNLKDLFEESADVAAAARMKPPAAAVNAPVREASSGARRSPVSMRLEVEDARVRIAGPWTPEPWESDPIDIRATLGPAAGGAHSEWTIEPVQLLTHSRLEPAVATSVLAYIAPVLAEATRTGGEFSLRLTGARLPVGDPAAGALAGVLSMHHVDLGPGPLAVKTIQELPLRLPPPPVVRFADEANVDFRLGDRRIWHTGLEFGVPLKQPGLRLDVHSSGSVGLDDDSLDLKLELPIPAALPQDRPVIAALAGRKISIGVGGTLDEPKVLFDGSIGETAGAVLAEVIERLRKPDTAPLRPDATVLPHGTPPVDSSARSTSPAPASGDESPRPSPLESITSKIPRDLIKDPTADAVIDLVGGVLEEVAKRRAERRAAEAAKSDKPPPREGGRSRPE
jgi:hypothetical protein